MTKAFEIYEKIKSRILVNFSTPEAKTSQNEALISLITIYTLFVGSEKLKAEVGGLDDIKGKAAVSKYITDKAGLLVSGGEFIPGEDDGSHLRPSTFISYTQIAMKFFIDKWDVSSPIEQNFMISQILTHNTLTYPRLVSYVQKWTPPSQSNLQLTLMGWLYGDMTDAFTGQENSKSNRLSIASQVAQKYQTMRDNKRTYCVFWGTLLSLVDRTFSLRFNQGELLIKLKANRTDLHTVLMGYISTQEIDIFIDQCFEDVYNWTVLGPDDD